jgi:integrase
MKGALRWVKVPTLKQRAKPPLLPVPVLWGDSVIMRAFDRQRLPPGTQWLFPSPVARGKPMDCDSVTHAFKRLVRSSGVRGCLTTHSLRHAAASAVSRACGNKKMVKQFLRHSDEDATDVYIHEPPESWARLRGCLRIPPLPK